MHLTCAIFQLTALRGTTYLKAHVHRALLHSTSLNLTKIDVICVLQVRSPPTLPATQLQIVDWERLIGVLWERLIVMMVRLVVYYKMEATTVLAKLDMWKSMAVVTV